MKNLKSKWMSVLLVIAMLLGLIPMNTAFAIGTDSRIPITEVEGTMTGYAIDFGDECLDEDGMIMTQPEFTLTKGSPAYFCIDSLNGFWYKWNKVTGDWEQYEERFFTEGKYRFEFQVRIDGPAGRTHVIDKNCKVKINGVDWGKLYDVIDSYDDISLGWINGPEINVTDSRIPITEVEGTMTGYTIDFGDECLDENGMIMTQPEFTLTKGSPAYFCIDSLNGFWHKWNEATGEWEQCVERFFKEGKYRFEFQVRVDGPAGRTHVIDKNCKVKINGVDWGKLYDVTDRYVDVSFGWINGPEIEVINPEAKIRAFVERLYTEVLGRPADSNIDEWVEVLSSKKETGAKVAMGFVDSQEFKNKSITDDEFIEIMYRTFLGRNSDPVGKEGWKKNLDEGVSRLFVFKGFVESDEFTKICDSYGIIRGNVELKAPMDQNEKVTKFVARCYKVFLGRKADVGGINAWTNQLLNGSNNAKEAVYGFVMSPEFQNKGLSNEDYVKTMYIGLMNREADSGGLKGWVDVLERGGSREDIFYGFADSQEFRDLARSYHLSGDWKAN